MEITLKKTVAHGKRRAFTIHPSTPVTAQGDGAYAGVQVIDGDSSAPTIDEESTGEKIKGWLHGDGSLGEKHVRIHIDGHLGKPNKVDGKLGDLCAEDIDIFYTVVNDQAPKVTFTEGETDDEPPEDE